MLVTGCLAGKGRGCVPGRPLALRHRLSPAVPLSVQTSTSCETHRSGLCSMFVLLTLGGGLETLSPRCRGVGSPRGGERFPLMVVLYPTHGKIQVHFAGFSCGDSHYQIKNVSFCSHVYLFCSHAAVTARASLWRV